MPEQKNVAAEKDNSRKNRYTAFISYRHLTPDEEIAKKLHMQIENFAIPSVLRKKLGRKGTGRVFRDQEELPLSADLGDDIHRALEESEWLICICSPRYLESRWCMEELRYFLALGRRDHVLTVLAEGKPEESFPEGLRYVTVDGKTVEKEPLAADVRAENLDGMLKKLKREKLRIIAPILGVNYDDLRQRARRRRNRIIASLTAAAITLLAGFLGYALVKNREISTERNSALAAESQWLSQSSRETLADGDRMLSLLLALEALPEDTENPERPVIDESVAALRSGVISGAGDTKYQPATAVTVPGLETYAGMDNVLYCFARKVPGFIAAYDMNTGKELEPPYTLSEEPSYFLFSDKGVGYSVFDDRIINTRGFSSEQYLKDLPEPVHFVADSSIVDHSYRLIRTSDAAVLMQRGIGVYSSRRQGGSYRTYSEQTEKGFCLYDLKPLPGIRGLRDETFLIGGYSSSNAEGGPAILQVYSGTDDEDNARMEYYFSEEKLQLRNPGRESVYLSRIDASCDGTVIAGASSDYLYFWNANQSEMVSAYCFRPKYTYLEVDKIAFSPSERDILCTLTRDGKVFLYDCGIGDIRLTVPGGLYKVTDFMWNSDGTRLLLTCDDGRARLVSTADGKTQQALEFGPTLEKAAFANADIYDNSSNDKYILLKGGETIQSFVLAGSETGRESSAVSILKDYTYTLEQGASKSNDPLDTINLSADGKTIWNMRDDGLYVLDAETYETKAVFRDGFSTGEYSDSNGTTLRCMGRLMIAKDYVFLVTNGEIQVYDPEKAERLTTLHGAYPHTYTSKYTDDFEDRSEASGFKSAAVSGDGKHIMASSGRPGWFGFQRDPSVFMYRKDTFEELWHMGLDSGDTGMLFDFAQDWAESTQHINLRSEFLENGAKTAVIYIYDPLGAYPDYDRHALFPKKPLHLVFEIRDSETGEVETMYHLPYAVDEYWLEPDYGVVLAQDSEMNVHVLNALTGEETAAIEKDDAIYAYEIDEASLRIRYTLKETDSFSSVGNEILYREGTVLEVPAAGLVRQETHADGVFDGQPFIAKADGLYSIESGKPILSWQEDEYIFLRAWEDGSRILCCVPYAAEDAFRPKENREGYIAVIRSLSLSELRDTALRILDGRELTEAQKEKYYLK